MSEGELTQLDQLAQLFQFDRLVMLAIGIAALIFAVKGVTYTARVLYQRVPSRRLLISQIATVLGFLIYTVGGVVVVFVALEPPRELMLAATGSVAVALGLSLKDLVASVIAGFILLFDRPFQVGDRVTLGTTYGEIKSIGLRAVRLTTLDDNEVTIPNNRFMTDVVASGNSGALDMMVECNFHIALDADVEQARDLLHEIVVTSRYVYLKKPVSIVVAEVAIAERLALQVRTKAYVLDVHFEKEFSTDVYVRGTEALRRNGIARPVVGAMLTTPGAMTAARTAAET
jgi:small-conductance mechanosensitive channel